MLRMQILFYGQIHMEILWTEENSFLYLYIQNTFAEYGSGNELKPIKELSLHDMQCKLNNGGASGTYSCPFEIYENFHFYLVFGLRKHHLMMSAATCNVTFPRYSCSSCFLNRRFEMLFVNWLRQLVFPSSVWLNNDWTKNCWRKWVSNSKHTKTVLVCQTHFNFFFFIFNTSNELFAFIHLSSLHRNLKNSIPFCWSFITPPQISFKEVWGHFCHECVGEIIFQR